jgi:hypothetical protein
MKAFVLSIVKLEEAMKKSGCPVCRLEHEAAVQYIDSFLWENTNDPAARQPINDAYGFCPEHTRMLVAIEMSNTGPLLGVNIIYELLAKNVVQDLQNIEKIEHKRRGIRAYLKKCRIYSNHFHKPMILKPDGQCPICDVMDKSGINILSTLFELLIVQNEKMIEVYCRSNGLCLSHLRIGLMAFMEEFPYAADLLIKDAIGRLDAQRVQMREYLRKHNWAYREEQLMPEERVAWLRTLTFFTGLPEEKFNHRIEEY